MKPQFFTDLKLSDEDTEVYPENACVHSQQFLTWAEQLCADYSGSVVKLNQAKVLLVDKFFEWRTYVPKSHRNLIGDRGHFCIFHVFELTYRKLRLAEISLTPPMLFLPSPPSPPATLKEPPAVMGITLGEVLGEE
jgi:hypothetical protein